MALVKTDKPWARSRFLNLLDDHTNLRSDVLDSRSDPQRFGELIKDRVRCGCERQASRRT